MSLSTDETIGRLLGTPKLTTTIGELANWHDLPQEVRAAVLFACAKTQLFILIVLTGYKSKGAKARMLEAINEGNFLDYIENPKKFIELRA